MPTSTAVECYVHAYDAPVVLTHGARTVENSAAYLISHLRPDMHILDVGCGPGSITIDFARRTPHGEVTGIDVSPTILEQARALAARANVPNVQFAEGDLRTLPFPDHTFDLVHAHQVLQYLSDPVGALREMRRVVKPGGLIAVREWVCSTMTWYPESETLEDQRDRYVISARRAGGEPNAGNRLVSWAMKAGFKRDEITGTGGTWCYCSPEEKAWFSKVMAERLVTAPLKYALEDEEDKQLKSSYIDAWKAWGEEEDGWFGALQGEIICHVIEDSQKTPSTVTASDSSII